MGVEGLVEPEEDQSVDIMLHCMSLKRDMMVPVLVLFIPARLPCKRAAYIHAYENHLYTPSPTMMDAVLVMAALLLLMPSMLLLARTAASFAVSWEWPDT